MSRNSSRMIVVGARIWTLWFVAAEVVVLPAKVAGPGEWTTTTTVICRRSGVHEQWPVREGHMTLIDYLASFSNVTKHG